MIKVEIYLLWFTYMCVQLFKFSVKMLQVYNSSLFYCDNHELSMISMWWMSAYWLYGGHLYSPCLQCYCLSREPHVHQNSSLSTCLKAEENNILHLLKTFRCVFDEHANFSTCMISRFYFRVTKRYSAHLYSLEMLSGLGPLGKFAHKDIWIIRLSFWLCVYLIKVITETHCVY
jgi:hypothetical protein